MKGKAEMMARLKKAKEIMPKALMAGLYQEMHIEKAESQQRCPVDVTKPTPHPGQLRSTAAVTEPVYENGKISCSITYGTDYAIYVHEILENYHPVGQAKFLESVLMESRPSLPDRVAARTRPIFEAMMG